MILMVIILMVMMVSSPEADDGAGDEGGDFSTDSDDDMMTVRLFTMMVMIDGDRSRNDSDDGDDGDDRDKSNLKTACYITHRESFANYPWLSISMAMHELSLLCS